MSADVTSIPAALADTVGKGGRLDDGDVRTLAALTDILALGALADDVRRRRHGATTTFVRVHGLDVSAPESWTAAPPGAGEVRLTGQPASLDRAVSLVTAARALAGPLPLRGFVLSELVALGGDAGLSRLVAAGLDEVAVVELGSSVLSDLASARGAGLAARVIGVARSAADRAGWLLDVRRVVEAAGDIDAVAPLARVADPSTPTTGFDDVRTVALARLVLNDVAHIQVDWQRHGPKLAQVALTVGADDLDAVTAADDTAQGVRRAPLEEVRRNIAAAGGAAVARDGRFRSLVS